MYSTVFEKISSPVARRRHQIVDRGRGRVQDQVVVVVVVLIVVLMVVSVRRSCGRSGRDHEIEVTGGIVQGGVIDGRAGRRRLAGRAAALRRRRPQGLLLVMVSVVRRVLLLEMLLL